MAVKKERRMEVMKKKNQNKRKENERGRKEDLEEAD